MKKSYTVLTIIPLLIFVSSYAHPIICTITANATSNTICTGGSVILTGGGATTYAWSGGVSNDVSFTPLTTTTYTVTGTNITTGCSGTATITIAVNPPNSSTSSPDTICAGTTIALIGTGGDSAYTWSGGITNGVAFTPAATNSYTVTGTATNGCISTDAITIVVSPLPNVNSIVTPSATVCAGTAVTLNGTGAAIYIWSDSTITNGVAFIPTASATYTVIGIDANGCNNTATATVTVNSLPVVNSTITPSATVCTGTSVTLSGTGAVSYIWSSGIINGKAFVPATTGTYTVTGTGANGCSNTYVDSVFVINSPQLKVNSATICEGTSATLTATGGNSYSWLPSTGLSNTTDSTVTANPGVTTTYTLTSSNSCGSDSTFSIVTVNPLPSGSITSSGIGCQSANVLFSGSNGTPPYNFTYQLNSPAIGAIQSTIITKGSTNMANLSLQNVALGTYTCSLISVKDSNLCSSIILNDSTTITVYQNPNALFTLSPQQTNILTPAIAVTDASVGADNWIWSFGDSSTSISQNPIPHIYKDTGTYTIRLVISSAIGCKDSTYQTVRITPFFALYVPNTFTPNGDGKNDLFMPKGEGMINFEMNIYDRWGSMIFSTDDINKGWDGKPDGGSQIAQTDTYVYVINLTALSDKKDYIYNGMFNLAK